MVVFIRLSTFVSAIWSLVSIYFYALRQWFRLSGIFYMCLQYNAIYLIHKIKIKMKFSVKQTNVSSGMEITSEYNIFILLMINTYTSHYD